MSRIKCSGSEIENLMGIALWRENLRGYRKNYKKVFGKPDIVFLNLKLAVFCDSEFWHGKDWSKTKCDIKSNKKFWHNKIEANIKRDRIVNRTLKKAGWVVLRFWGKDIERSLDKCIRKIEERIMEQKLKTYTQLRNRLDLQVKNGDSEELANFTHYLHTYYNGISKLFKKYADEYIERRKADLNLSNRYKAKDFVPLKWDIPFPPPENHKFTFIDLFAGVGGFRIAFQDLGGRCVFSSELDYNAKVSYEANFGEVPFGDITKIDEKDIPNHDILCAGFPCQAFSIAGRRGGFEDTRGTLFFHVARIIKEKKPKVIFLENVKGLVNHDKGNTLNVILKTLREDLGYYVPDPKVMNAKDFGVPQNRERIFIVGFSKELGVSNFKYPNPSKKKQVFKSVKEKSVVSSKYYLSTQYLDTLRKHKQRHADKGNGFGYEIISDEGTANAIVVGGMGRERNLVYDDRLKDFTPVTKIKGKVNREGIRKMTPREWARLQGFPDKFKIVVSDVQIYKQFGNSVAIPAIKATGRKLIKEMLKSVRK